MEAADLLTKFPADVKHSLNQNATVFLDWIQKRSAQVLDGSYSEFIEEFKKMKLHQHSWDNYKLANRLTLKKLTNDDLIKAKYNTSEYLTNKRQHLSEKRRDNENPNFIFDRSSEPKQEYPETRKPLRGYLTPRDYKEI